MQLFNMLVLGSLTDSNGLVWTRSPKDFFMVETTVSRNLSSAVYEYAVTVSAVSLDIFAFSLQELMREADFKLVFGRGIYEIICLGSLSCVEFPSFGNLIV